MGVVLWDAPTGGTSAPAIADAKPPGRRRHGTNPPAFFNVDFRTAEPLPSVTAASTRWRTPLVARRDAGHRARPGNISQVFQTSASQARRRATVQLGRADGRPHGPILASHFEPARAPNFASECGFGGATNPSSCVPSTADQLQPYAI